MPSAEVLLLLLSLTLSTRYLVGLFACRTSGGHPIIAKSTRDWRPVEKTLSRQDEARVPGCSARHIAAKISHSHLTIQHLCSYILRFP